jgi:phosphopantothenoylcysteine decarboxylase / phosphopantothenate---cysteine ligase
LARLFIKLGAEVDVLLTRAATEFIGPLTFAAITGKPAHTDMFDAKGAGESHVALSARTNLVVVAPATADVLSRMAAGRADDLVTATLLCSTCPIVVAPAMHPHMWSHPATERNVAQLEKDGCVEFVGPELGEVASGDIGRGRMADPEQIAYAVQKRLTTQDLAGRHIVITAGPTVEDIDPVRVLSNRSSGKMGFALASCAHLRGARVTLLSGPVALPTPIGVTRVDIRSAAELRVALWDTLRPDLSGSDALIMAAAVGDYRPAQTASTKLARGTEALSLSLVPNADILAEVGHARKGALPCLVGFAVETGIDTAVIDRAREKRVKKAVDLVVANHAEESLGRDNNRVFLVQGTSEPAVYSASKPVIANHILDWLALRLRELG